MTISDRIHSDLLIIRGGINGTVTACDAAGPNQPVCLAEIPDFAEGTSSHCLKLLSSGL
jgi:glycerol-3-phosphate dehydrogenase